MFMIGPVGFAAPWLLWALAALPVLWFLLRAVPPAPIRRRFPGIALLLGLRDEETETDRTPWWLLLLRMAAIALAIIAFAGPVLNPQVRAPGSGPLLVALDATWADARDWARRIDRALQLVEDAGRDGRPVAVVRLSAAPEAVAFQSADQWQGRLAAMEPNPWAPSDLALWSAALPEGGFETWWLSDGLDHPGRAGLMSALSDRGPVTVFESSRPVLALHPPGFADGAVTVAASRLPAAGPVTVDVAARGPDPAGIDRVLARASLAFAAGGTRAEVALSLPPELRNRVTRFELAGIRSAGAVSLTDDSLKRRKVALIGGRDDREGLQLLSPTHYLRQALAPVADLMEGDLSDILPARPDVVVLADVAALTQAETDATLDWLEEGGLLLRFAGPRLAASDVGRAAEDPLMPVRLREGGRNVGGAMSWGEPKGLAPFAEGSPFFGLPVPEDVQVSQQVLAQPDPELAGRTIAALADGTPLVTRKEVGQGQVVLVHVTANAEWSTLPLSGLFVQILERLAVSTRPALPQDADLAGQVWTVETTLNAWGEAVAAQDMPGIDGADLAAALKAGPSAGYPPGLYAGADRRIALNVMGAETTLAAAAWPAGTRIEGIDVVPEQSLKGLSLALALGVLMLDILAALWLSGRLTGGLRRGAAALVTGLILAAPLPGGRALAQDDPTATPADPAAEAFALDATTNLRLAYVLTGDAQVDDISLAGLRGLGEVLWQRTAIEPADPMGVDIERDELAFFPFLYWPVSTAQDLPSAAAYQKLNRYLRTGGMILFDTRDGDFAGAGGDTPEAQHLRRLAAGLDVPPLEPIPPDHVLTRTFYLLQDFPGRHTGAGLWVEAAPPEAEQAEGMPFRNLNDGVTPVVIGGNDFAAAWAMDDRGVWMYPVGRGFAGERQREMAARFGVNIVMHVLTGNYKSDQVHVPALLERLGQ